MNSSRTKRQPTRPYYGLVYDARNTYYWVFEETGGAVPLQNRFTETL